MTVAPWPTAVRMGQLTLGVGNIIGGNVYDTLMIPLADVAYVQGPLRQRSGVRQVAGSSNQRRCSKSADTRSPGLPSGPAPAAAKQALASSR